MGWMRENKLRLNPDKTEVLLVRSMGIGCIPSLAVVALTPKPLFTVWDYSCTLSPSVRTDSICDQECMFPASTGTPTASLPGYEGPCLQLLMPWSCPGSIIVMGSV